MLMILFSESSQSLQLGTRFPTSRLTFYTASKCLLSNIPTHFYMLGKQPKMVIRLRRGRPWPKQGLRPAGCELTGRWSESVHLCQRALAGDVAPHWQSPRQPCVLEKELPLHLLPRKCPFPFRVFLDDEHLGEMHTGVWWFKRGCCLYAFCIKCSSSV